MMKKEKNAEKRGRLRKKKTKEKKSSREEDKKRRSQDDMKKGRTNKRVKDLKRNNYNHIIILVCT